MPGKYIQKSFSHTLIGGSDVYVASYLHMLLFGRVQLDDECQEFFDKRSLKIQPKTFFALTEALLDGKKVLEALENGDGEEMSYDKSMIYFHAFFSFLS